MEQMNIKTKDGIAEPLPLSDIQRNNRILTALTIAVYTMLVIVLWVIWKVLSTGAVNTYISHCVG